MNDMTQNIIPCILSFRDKHAAFSNFFEKEIVIGGISYNTAENAFQAQKTFDNEERFKISKMSPKEAKRYCGKRGSLILRRDWEAVKYAIMREVVEAKFRQYEELKSLLLSTGHAYLVEGNTWHDNEWGDCFCSKCANKHGQNKLGAILMDIREVLRTEQSKNGDEHVIEFEDGMSLVVSNDRQTSSIGLFLRGPADIDELIASMEYSAGEVKTEIFEPCDEDPRYIAYFKSKYTPAIE